MKLYEALAAGDRQPADLYDAALAHLSEGFRSSNPALIQAALKLLMQLDTLAVRFNLPVWKLHLAVHVPCKASTRSKGPILAQAAFRLLQKSSAGCYIKALHLQKW